MKRYCDYDAIVHYKEGTFASQFADDMKGKLENVERDVLEPWETESFLDGKYETYISREPIVMYRLYGKYKREEAQPVGARLGGRFVSTEFAESAIDAKLRLALKPDWMNTKMYEARLIVPAGTRLNIGVVAPVTMPSGEVLPGGAPQIMLPNLADKDRKDADLSQKEIIQTLQLWNDQEGCRYAWSSLTFTFY